jgi:hypothetical protein
MLEAFGDPLRISVGRQVGQAVLAGTDDANLRQLAKPYCRLAVRQVPFLGPIIAPWHPGFDPTAAIWVDLTGTEVRSTYPDGFSLGETLGQVVTRVWRSSDASALDPEGLPAGPGTEALLTPAPLVVTSVRVVGKESRHLGAGRETLTRPDHADYGGQDFWPDIHEALRLLASESQSKVGVASEVGVSTRWLDEIVSGRAQPAAETKERLREAVARRARDWIHQVHGSIHIPESDIGAISAYLELSPSAARKCHQCGRLLTGRQQRWCSTACRKRYERRPVEQPALF